jgi:hypothetical protein
MGFKPVARLLAVCLLLPPACHGKGQGHAVSQAGSCLGVPNTPIGTDLVYPVYGPDTAPGSASHPLPITRAIEMFYGKGCVDGENALWMSSARILERYDANLTPTFEVIFTSESKAYNMEFEYVEGLDCDAHGVWVVIRKSSNGSWTLRTAYYTKDGLAEEHTMSASTIPQSIRLGPDGPLLVFLDSSLIIDGTSYERPADKSVTTESAVVRVLPVPNLPRVVWIPGSFAVDADGSYLAAWPEWNDASILNFKRYGADGVENTSRQIPGEFHEVIGAVKTTSQGHLILAGDGGGDLPEESDDSPILANFILALDRDGNLLWSRRFHGTGDLRLAGVAVAGDSAWLYGKFWEWIESDGLAAFGQMGAVREGRYMDSGWDHRFVAVLDAAGGLSHLEPLGDHPDTDYAILPADENHAVMLGSAAENASETTQVGLTGPLPQRFIGNLDLTGRLPVPMPPQPDEQLPRLALPQDLGKVVDVRPSHDGNAYVVLQKDKDLNFVDYPSGQIQPPFHLPGEGWYRFNVERIGPDLFLGMTRYRAQGSKWIEMETLNWDGADAETCHDPVVSGDWLFGVCARAVFGWRRQGESWQLATRSDEAGGSALDADGSFLAVGDASAKGLRAYEGVAYVFPITADGLGTPVLLKPSDPLPYDPGYPASVSDYMPGPPPGKYFGSAVQVATPWVVVSDQEASYGFEQVGETWVERWKQKPAGVLLGDKYYVLDATESRGHTHASGVLHIYERKGNAWEERQRVVPSQRWASRFGQSFVRLADHLLVSAPGYGIPEGSEQGNEGGAVFSIPFGSCP